MSAAVVSVLALSTADAEVDNSKKYLYEPGAVRWLPVREGANPRAHRPLKGWTVAVLEMDHHPITFNKLQQPQTWIRETYRSQS